MAELALGVGVQEHPSSNHPATATFALKAGWFRALTIEVAGALQEPGLASRGVRPHMPGGAVGSWATA
jgi:hypothetical protein